MSGHLLSSSRSGVISSPAQFFGKILFRSSFKSGSQPKQTTLSVAGGSTGYKVSGNADRCGGNQNPGRAEEARESAGRGFALSRREFAADARGAGLLHRLRLS